MSITLAPPALPVYEQPVLVEEGGIWAPGYWEYNQDGYFWVPGTWVQRLQETQEPKPAGRHEAPHG